MNIVRKINQFYKMAGLLKVPEKFLKEATDWIVGKYCYQMSQKLLQKVNNLKQRTQNVDRIRPKIAQWEKIWIIIDDIRTAVTPEQLNVSVNELVNFCQTQENEIFDFPGFNPYENDKDEMRGIISENRQSLYLNLIKNSDDNYGFVFTGNYKGKPDDEASENINIKFEIWEPEISAQNIQKEIRKVYPQFEQLMIIVNRLLPNYDEYNTNYINQYIMMYALCKKLADKFPSIEYEDRLGKMFEMSASDSEYTKHNFGVVVFWVDLVKDRSKTNGHRGIWQGVQKNKKSDYIGSALVVGNVDEDIDKINSFKALQARIYEIADIARHELQHAMQDFIAKINDLSEDGGLPGKNIRDKRVDFHGRPIDPTYPQQLMDKSDEGGRIQHALRDTEFYNRISDEVSHFNLNKNKMPLSLQKEFLRAWICDISEEQFIKKMDDELRLIALKQLNIDPTKIISDSNSTRLIRSFKWHLGEPIQALIHGRQFFEKLKQYQPEKYRKAVIEFIKAVGL